MEQANNYQKKIAVAVFISAMLILVYGMYQLGGYNMCLKSEGTLLSDGHCINTSSLNYCVGEYDGQVKKFEGCRG